MNEPFTARTEQDEWHINGLGFEAGCSRTPVSGKRIFPVECVGKVRAIVTLMSVCLAGSVFGERELRATADYQK